MEENPGTAPAQRPGSAGHSGRAPRVLESFQKSQPEDGISRQSSGRGCALGRERGSRAQPALCRVGSALVFGAGAWALVPSGGGAQGGGLGSGHLSFGLSFLF